MIQIFDSWVKYWTSKKNKNELRSQKSFIVGESKSQVTSFEYYKDWKD